MELTPKKFKMGKIKTLIESFGNKQEKGSDFQALCNLSDPSDPQMKQLYSRFLDFKLLL